CSKKSKRSGEVPASLCKANSATRGGISSISRPKRRRPAVARPKASPFAWKTSRAGSDFLREPIPRDKFPSGKLQEVVDCPAAQAAGQLYEKASPGLPMAKQKALRIAAWRGGGSGAWLQA